MQDAKNRTIIRLDGAFLQLTIWGIVYSVIGTIVVVRMFLRKER